MKKAIFLDRDGIINVDYSYVHKQEDFEFCEGVFETLQHFISLDYILFIVTNQSGIGRGYYTSDDFNELTSWMLCQFELKNINITKVYHCPHAPEIHCKCRKPATGMFEMAQSEYEIDMKKSWMIGDKPSDIQAALNAKISQSIFVNNFTCKEASFSVKSIFDTIKIIKK